MRILITGTNSYIGRSLNEYLKQWPDKYHIEFLSLRSEGWKTKNFSGYDTIIHAAAVVHRKEDLKLEEYYFKVNRDLTFELGSLAQKAGVRQFIFLSSMSVYGLEEVHKCEDIVITKDTPCFPKTLYGKSKFEAESLLQSLHSEDFHVAIIRPPMIYGPSCPGNYGKLRTLAFNTPIFPLFQNERSMLYIDNLSEFLRLLINNNESGMFFPQNNEYVNTSTLVKLIGKYNNRKIRSTKMMNPILRFLKNRNKLINKMFGSLKYDFNLSLYNGDFQYCAYDLSRSVELTEKKNKENLIN